MPVIFAGIQSTRGNAVVCVQLWKVQTRLAQQPSQPDQRQTDQRGRVFALDLLEQRDAQRFGLETAGAIEGALVFEIAFDFTGVERAEAHPRQIRKERALVCAPRIDHAYRRVEMYFAPAARAQLFACDHKFARLAQNAAVQLGDLTLKAHTRMITP